MTTKKKKNARIDNSKGNNWTIGFAVKTGNSIFNNCLLTKLVFKWVSHFSVFLCVVCTNTRSAAKKNTIIRSPVATFATANLIHFYQTMAHSSYKIISCLSDSISA